MHTCKLYDDKYHTLPSSDKKTTETKTTQNPYKQTKTTNKLPTLIINKIKTQLESHNTQKRTVSFKKTIESLF